MSPGARSLAHRLALDHGPGDTSTWPSDGAERRIFGGMLLAHALGAARATVAPDRRAHSLHGSFLGAGDGRRPIRYAVERTRDGASFATRRVVATQDGTVLFTATASFHTDEDGASYELPDPAGIPGPDDLPTGRYASEEFDSRDDPEIGGGLLPHSRRAWFRPRVPLPDDPALHEQALAYLSDHGPTRAVRQPHAAHPGVEGRMSVSLDHSLWLHRPARVDGWVRSELAPAATGAGRGLALGSLRSADGTLLATVAQEALLRLPGDVGPPLDGPGGPGF